MEGNKMELVISTELAPGVGLPAEIMFNYDELKSQLTEYVAKYDGLVVGDGEVAEARRIRAEINRVIGQLTKAGTETKAKWNSPLDVFLKRVRELVAIAKPIEAQIGEQIKAHDAELRERKRAEVRDALLVLVNEAVKSDGDELAQPFVESDHWGNCIRPEMLTQSASAGRTRAQLEAEVKRCREQVESARRIYGPKGEEWVLKAYYALARWDYDAATAFRDVDGQIAEAERIARQRAAEEARAKAEAERAAEPPEADAEELAKRRLAERRAAMRAGQSSSGAPDAPAQGEPPKAAPAPANDPEMTYTLRITGPRARLFALRDWLTANGLKFEKV